ncbi:MAG: TRAP transporter small permease [Alphaproteobacteria bacterium]|nr:TRAP transporter small permease [Alphaproteobacteria bacterium]
MLDKLLVQAGRVSHVAAWMGGALLLAAATVVTVEVLARKFFGWSMQGADELSGYAFAIACSWAFGLAVLQRANVRIDGLYLLVPIPLRAIMDIAALLILGLYVAALLSSGWVLWQDSYTFTSRSITSWRTPLAIPQGLWLAGWLWMALILTLLLLRCVQALMKGGLADVVAVAGVRTMAEEVKDELAAAAEEVAHERELRSRRGDA